MIVSSKDGKGRTLFDILVGRNKRDLTPLELQYHNPLSAKVGCRVTIDDPELSGITFLIEKISVYETKIKQAKFYHTDYHLKAVTLESDKPIRHILRLIPDVDETNKLGHKIQILSVFKETEWNEDLHNDLCDENNVDEDGEKIYLLEEDSEGNALIVPNKYWRIENVFDPYRARVTILADKDGDGTIEESELERVNITYWDHHRVATFENGQSFKELLTVEMGDNTHFFKFFLGKEIEAFQVTVI